MKHAENTTFEPIPSSSMEHWVGFESLWAKCGWLFWEIKEMDRVQYPSGVRNTVDIAVSDGVAKLGIEKKKRMVVRFFGWKRLTMNLQETFS